jgi:hypothetical protein
VIGDTIAAVRVNGCCDATDLSLRDGEGSIRRRNDGSAKGSQRVGRELGRDGTGCQQHA